MINVEVKHLDKEYYRLCHRPGDVDHVAAASIAFGEFHELTNGGQPFTQGNKRLYMTFEDFAKDACHCLIGKGGWDQPMSPREELERAWALLNNTRNASDPAAI